MGPEDIAVFFVFGRGEIAGVRLGTFVETAVEAGAIIVGVG